MDEKLVLDNMKLVNWVIHTKLQYIPKLFKKDMRDLEQEGYVLLVKSAKKFDKSKGYKFSTFATNNIYLGLKSFIDRHSDRYEYQGYSLENECSKFEDDSMSWKDLLEFKEEGFEELETIELIEYIKKANIEKINEIVDLKLKGLTTREVSKSLGISWYVTKNRLIKLREQIS